MTDPSRPICISGDEREGEIRATVEIGVPRERVFRALASDEIVDWWIRPGVFDTREWRGDLRPGGHWTASGYSRGSPYTLEGDYVEVDPPRKLVYTWRLKGDPEGSATTVSFTLDELDNGRATRLILVHSGFSAGARFVANHAGWETSLRHLIELFKKEGQS